MGLFDRLFGQKEEAHPQPDIRFGRYSDSYKSNKQYDAWDSALEMFEAEEYLKAYRLFFKYLKDEEIDNVITTEEKGEIHFEIYQGSKKIIGVANERKVKAEAKIAKSKELNIGFMRRLMEQNFSLKYSRFALDHDNNITIAFDTYVLDGSPYKLYYALKEVATNADKQDDLLLDEFTVLEPVGTGHLIALQQDEKTTKYNFIINQISRVIEQIETGKLKAEQYPGGIAYLLLNLIYKLDYLVVPEGFMMEALERSHRQYFAKDGRTTLQKNNSLQKEFQKLKERPKEEYFKEMYKVVSTFGITNPVNHDRLVGFIDGELQNMDWYFENKHYDIALAIPGYIVGFCLFNHSLPEPDKDFLLLYYKIMEQSYFQQLGFTLNLVDDDSFQEKAMKRAIKNIVNKHIDKYPNLNPDTSTLNYKSLPIFAKSYLMMVRNMDLTKSE